MMGSWNTDGGVCRHTTPVIEWLRSEGFEVSVLTHYKESPFGRPLEVEDEDFVTRCYATSGKQAPGRPALDAELLRRTVEGFDVLVLEDLGMLPCRELAAVLPEIKKAGVDVFLLNHDNVPKPEGHPFWQCLKHVDAVINFLPEQNRFMSKHFPPDRIHLTDFPCYPVQAVDKDKARVQLGLPRGRKIILTLGEYDFAAPFSALSAARSEDPAIYLVALVYEEKDKTASGYDEIRVENGPWRRRAQYAGASDLIILDKGESCPGNGAVLSSTAYQLIGWGCPILARDNRYFSPLGDAVAKYTDDAGLKEQVRRLLNDAAARGDLNRRASAFASARSPERVAHQLLNVFRETLDSRS